MKLELFIAKRLVSNNRYRFSKPIIRLIIFSISLGLSAILLSVAIVKAYKVELVGKMSGFAGAIQIRVYDMNDSFGSKPILYDENYTKKLMNIQYIKTVSSVAFKSGIIKTKNEVEGIVIKGVGKDFNKSFLKKNLKSGKIPSYDISEKNDSVVISSLTANKLHLKIGDQIRMYFFDRKILKTRGRKFIVGGIFETGMEQFDQQFLIADIRHVQKLNHWEENQISALEIQISDFENLRSIEKQIIRQTDYENDVKRVDELYPAMFQWLKLHDKNVEVIIGLVLMIAVITMISLLLILILERIQLIGILKALGCTHSCVRKIFVIQSAYIVGQAIFFGNLFSYGLIFLQSNFHIIPLDKSSYYVSYIPMQADWVSFLLINAGAIVLSLIVLLIPSIVITKISPLKAIRFS